MKLRLLGVGLFSALMLVLLMAGCSSGVKNMANLLPPTCSEEPRAGYCKASVTKYYFDLDEGSCKSFEWGGCGGVIPFETEMACRQACLGEEAETE
jgi:hypothetical protein